ncbi:MAG: LytTR family DNA-binding domain-containing protein [Bacteroidota bacterium]|nr:LytTR family DNA-binding domain-containing protein [Bacteroidota bacterium]MDP4227170.1 LytTR family DNA-binding domain-containing protein [Bacteroidota bacterium]
MDSSKNQYNCIIIDDEFLARKLISDYLAKIPELNLVGSFDSPLTAMGLLQKEQIDIVFLDIQMPDISGIDFIKNIPFHPLIIFVTAYPEFALQGFELNVIEYLVKPVSFPRFLKAVNIAIEIAETRRKAELYEQARTDISEERSRKANDFIVIKSERKIIKLSYDDIFFIEGALEYVTFQTKEKQIMGLFSLKELEKTLPSNKFMRIHKSYIVSLEKITEIEGNQVKLGKWTIPVSKVLRPKLLKYFEKNS